MSNTQLLALLFIAIWAVVIFAIGYYFGNKDGKTKATFTEHDLADQAHEDLIRKLGEARVLNRRLMCHFEVIESRLMELELGPQQDHNAFRREKAA